MGKTLRYPNHLLIIFLIVRNCVKINCVLTKDLGFVYIYEYLCLIISGSQFTHLFFLPFFLTPHHLWNCVAVSVKAWTRQLYRITAYVYSCACMCTVASPSLRLYENKEQPKKGLEMSVCSKLSLNISTPGVSLPTAGKNEADALIQNGGKKPISGNTGCIYKSCC